MWCLTLATNAIVTWTTEYHGLAVTALRRAGQDIDDAVLAHIWPTHHENVHFYGTHSVDVGPRRTTERPVTLGGAIG
jgi:hypothetical protein